TLANDTTKQAACPLLIVAAERGTVAVAEIELRQIPVKMLLAAELINAAHPAFEDRKEAFDGVGIGVAAHILANPVLHRTMLGEVVSKVAIGGRLISHNVALAVEISLNDWQDGRHANALNDHRTALAAALDKRQHFHL